MINDERIMNLKLQIKEKEDSMKKAKKFVPVTNCSVEMNGVRFNINTMNREGLIELLIRLNSLRLSAIDLGFEKECMLSGYNVEDWIADIEARLEVLAYSIEKSKLQALERKLHELLSTDKKVELEIDSIINSLK